MLTIDEIKNNKSIMAALLELKETPEEYLDRVNNRNVKKKLDEKASIVNTNTQKHINTNDNKKVSRLEEVKQYIQKHPEKGKQEISNDLGINPSYLYVLMKKVQK